VSGYGRLGAADWSDALRGQPELLRVAREQVPLLEEARACVARRARQQAWSEDHPLHGVLQTLQAQQTRLDALARKRLAGLWGLERLSFVEVLEQLETVTGT
jgi:hypothetical protein